MESLFENTNIANKIISYLGSKDKNNSYNYVLEHIVNSIDVFGLGFTLQFMINCFKRSNALNLKEYTRLSSLFSKMYDFNPLTRIVDIEFLLDEYETILLENGILTRLNVSFNNHKLEYKPSIPNVIVNQKKIGSNHLSRELQEIASNDPVEISVKCKEKKELNTKKKNIISYIL